MKNIIYFIIFITVIFSCRISKYSHPNQISLKETNKIIKDVLKKTTIVDSSKDIILFNNYLYLNGEDVIYNDNLKNGKLYLKTFNCIRNEKRIKLVNNEEIKSDSNIIGYWNIGVYGDKEGVFYISISSDFFIPPARQPIEIYGMSYMFKYKIVKGKAKLIIWRGS